ncbi:MAG: VWA domain-containing protein [Treponemataceae bacterium]|nr:VWA domain-containing protein [Treponemataceae bacterium]
MKKILHCLMLLVLITSISFAEEKETLDIRIDQINSNDYPQIKAYTVIKKSNGEILSGLSPNLFSFRIDSEEVKISSKIVPFSMTNESTDYTILISNNGIMDGEPLDFQKNAVIKFIEFMNEKDTLSVYTIGEDAGLVCENVTKETFDSAVINSIEVSVSQPRLYDSIINLLRKVEQKKNHRKVIIVLSDGRDQNSRFSKSQMEETLGQSSIPIYTVGIRVLSNQTLSILDSISELTGGSYFYSSMLSSIPDNLKKIIDCCNHAYVINLKVKSLKADNLNHILEVQVDERDSRGKGLKTFVAVKHPFPKWLRLLIIILCVLLIVSIIFVKIFQKIRKRRNMGISRRKCPDCKNIMKDSWETCPFCKYLPENKLKTRRQ